ncbi:hypothetical protein HDU97_003995 [Phlyctochytrium planicorne]|nr:hypothetical protein HDU97_003995 [Phlyctochytrium planicorne]
MSDAECLIVRSSFPSLSIPTTGCCNGNSIICESGRLRALRLPTSSLSGNLPKQLANLENLEELELASNRFVGSIPEEWGQMSKLQHLWLDRNYLDGKIPAWVMKSNPLKYVKASTKALTASVLNETALHKLISLPGYPVMIIPLFIFWKGRNPGSSKPVKSEAMAPSFNRVLQSEAGFLVSKSVAVPSIPDAVVDVDSEDVSRHVERNAFSSSIKKPGGLFTENAITTPTSAAHSTVPSRLERNEMSSSIRKPGGLFSGEAVAPEVATSQVSGAMWRNEKIEVGDYERKQTAPSSSSAAWPSDIKSPFVMSKEPTLAATEIFQSNTLSNEEVDLIFEKKEHEAATPSAPPRGSSISRTVAVMRQPILKWSVEEVSQWLSNELGMRTDVVELFKEKRVDGGKLLMLTDSDLVDMGLGQGYVRLSILTAVGDLSSGVTSSVPSSDVPPPYMGN